MGQGQGIAVGKKQGRLPFAPGGGKIEILLDTLPWLNLKRFIAVGAAEGATVMRTAGGNLED